MPEAASLCLHERRSLADTSLASTDAVSAGKASHEAGKVDEVREAQEGTPLAQEDLQIGGDKVCPLRWYRADGRLIDLQQQPFAVAVVALADAGELPPAEGMERMGYAYKMLARGGNGCIPD
jgi:hypothetical protein